MPSPQTAEQLIAAAAEAPLNNLVILLALFALVIVLAGLFVIWKFVPPLYNLYKQQAETNAKLTQIVQQNSSRVGQVQVALSQNNTGMMDLGVKIDTQTNTLAEVIKQQNKEYHDYQVLVSDNLSSHDSVLSNNTDALVDNTSKIEALTVSIDSLKVQLEAAINERRDCGDQDGIMGKLLLEVVRLRTELQQRRSTGEVAIVTIDKENHDESHRLPDSSAKPTG